MNPSPKYGAGQKIQNWHTGMVLTITRARRWMPTVGWRYDTLSMYDLPLEDVNFYRVYTSTEGPSATFESVPVLAPKTHKARRNLAELRGEVPHYAGEVRTGWTYADHDPMRVRLLPTQKINLL
jgi:hypothetical protein